MNSKRLKSCSQSTSKSLKTPTRLNLVKLTHKKHYDKRRRIYISFDVSNIIHSPTSYPEQADGI
jgi:hypothetical protein